MALQTGKNFINFAFAIFSPDESLLSTILQKNMKKLFITAALLGSFASQSTFAKTEGNYIGIDAIRTELRFDKVKGSALPGDIGNDNETSVGVNYKYAFNFDNFFVAPGLFYDYAHAKAISTGTFGLGTPFRDDLELNHRFGAKLDLGYDITNKFAAFATVGAANNSVRVLWRPQYMSNHTNGLGLIYGVGAKYSVTHNIDFNLGYEFSNARMKDLDGRRIDFNVNVARAGVAYKF